ncbi:MAG: MerR family transcriptional regulator [Rikenellaceae bacterium]|jgi:DNA-binding transcriptional MerR regulator|nr:MerR family transcriptional regulator [Rikenellaceae bacterium]
MEEKSRKIYYTMGEVTEMLDVSHSLVRHWEKNFPMLKPHKNKKGNRLFTPADVETLKLIYHLVKEKGMTLAGAKMALKKGHGEVSREAELMERLQTVRSLLEEIRQELKDNEDTPGQIVLDTALVSIEPKAVVEVVQQPEYVPEPAPQPTPEPEPAPEPETATFEAVAEPAPEPESKPLFIQQSLF